MFEPNYRGKGSVVSEEAENYKGDPDRNKIETSYEEEDNFGG